VSELHPKRRFPAAARERARCALSTALTIWSRRCRWQTEVCGG
jgi:hypothetical protein